MKKYNLHFVTVSLLMFISLTVYTQPTIQWQKSLGGTGNEVARFIQQTTDGGYIIAGESASTDGNVTGNHGSEDSWVVKLDSDGAIQWQKSMGGSSGDMSRCIQQTNDGGYIVAGGSKSYNGDLTSNYGSWDYWIVKLDSMGNIQWKKVLGGSMAEVAHSIQQTADGGYIINGDSGSDDYDVSGNHGGWDYWVVKLDSTGYIQWQKSLGGSGSDEGRSIQQTFDGGYIATGYSTSNNGNVTNNHGDKDFWVVKLDSLGNLQWQKSLGGDSTDFALSIKQTLDSGYVVAGYTFSNDGDVTGNHGNSDYWVVKLDGFGSIQWQKTFGGTGDDGAKSINQTSDGGFIVAGYSGSYNGDLTINYGLYDYWVAKLGNNGSVQWQKSFGGAYSDYANSIIQTTDESFIIAGNSSSNDKDVTGNHGGNDYWVVKLNSKAGIETNKSDNNYSVYPIPANNKININVHQSIIGLTYTLSDIASKTILTGKLTNENTVLDISSLTSGMYLFNIVGTYGQTIKILKH